MRNSSPLYFLGLILGLSFPACGLAQSAPSAKAEGVSIRFEGYFDSMWNTYYGADASLAYETARSNQVRSVQWTQKWLDGNHTPAIPRSLTFDLFEINDFAACAALEPLSYANYTSDTGRKDPAPKLFDVSTFDHELVLGHCVAAKPAGEVSASHIVRVGGTNQIDIVTGNRQQSFGRRDHYQPLAALGINITSSGHDLWSKDGMSRALDPLTDAQLVRAINASPSLRLASLRIIEQRLQQGVAKGCRLTHSVVLKQTGPTVLQAILDRKTLSQGNSEIRLQTMRALSAVRASGNRVELVEQLLSGLAQPIEDDRPPAEIERQRRVQGLIGKAAATPEGQETFRDTRHFEVAAGLSLLSGSDVAEAIAIRFGDYLRDRILGSLADQPCTDELVAGSSYGATVAMDLIRKVDTEKFAIPHIQLRIQNMAAIAVRHSLPLKAMIAERCATSEGFLPNGDRSQALAFCHSVAE